MARIGQVSEILCKKLLPLAAVNLLGKMGRVWLMEKFLQLIIFQDSKFQKVYPLKILTLVKIQIQTQGHSTVAGLLVKVLEKDIDGTIMWVKVTHTESE